jgi:uncharacterized protein (TIGR02246 family)
MWMDEQAVRRLYESLISAWNQQYAAGMAGCFAETGNVIGFDGSQMTGPAEIETTISTIFSHHRTGRYYPIVREVRQIGSDVALLRADVGMVPIDEDDINPDLNAVQSMVARNRAGSWRIELFQNTPSVLHSQTETRETLTAELRDLLAASR